MNDNVTSTEEFQRVLECERQFQHAFQQGIEEEQQRKLKIEKDQAMNPITPSLPDATAISEAEVAKFVGEQRAYQQECQIAKLELEIELLKARLDECRRTIAELIAARKP